MTTARRITFVACFILSLSCVPIAQARAQTPSEPPAPPSPSNETADETVPNAPATAEPPTDSGEQAAPSAPVEPEPEPSPAPAELPPWLHSLRKSVAGETICRQPQIAAALGRAQLAVVWVTSVHQAGLGFCFHSKRHVVVPFRLVEAGREVVVARGDEEQTATVVAVDEQFDLALLELASPLSGMRPLRPVASRVQHGTPVLAVARAYDDGGSQLSITPGVVTSVGRHSFHTSALVSYHQSLGGPILDCDGALVGTASTFYGDEVTPVGRIRDLAATKDQQEPYRGGWSLLHPSFSMLVQLEPGSQWLGLQAGTSLVGYDQVQFPMRIAGLARVGPMSTDPMLQHLGARLQFDTGVGYRWLLSGGEFPLYVVPSLGGSFGYEWQWEERVKSQVTQSGCSPANPCDVEHSSERLDLGNRFRAAPTVGLGLLFSYAELSYTLQLDVEQPSSSTHQVLFGVQM